MKENKAKYQYVQDNVDKLVKDKIDNAITKSLILRWIKGRNWEGGLGNGKDVNNMFERLMKDYGLDADNLGDRFDKLCDFWEAQFKKAKPNESRKIIEATINEDVYSVVKIVDVGDFSKDKMEVGTVKGTSKDVEKKAKKYGKIKSIDHSRKEIIVESSISEEYVNEGKVTVDNFKKWLQDQVDSDSTPKTVKDFIQKQLNEIETVKKKFGPEKERKMCQRLANEIWELNLEVIIK